MIGFPEAALTLSHATIALALAPKSNAATTAIAAALEDVRKGLAGPVPAASARRPLQGRGQARPRPGLRLSARCARRHRRPAVRAGRGAGQARTTRRRATAPRRGTRTWWRRCASGCAAERARVRARAPAGRGQRVAASKRVCIARRSSVTSRTGSGKSKRASKHVRPRRSAPAVRSGRARAAPPAVPGLRTRAAGALTEQPHSVLDLLAVGRVQVLEQFRLVR